VDSKLAAQPSGLSLQPIRLTGARHTVSRKAYVGFDVPKNFDDRRNGCRRRAAPEARPRSCSKQSWVRIHPSVIFRPFSEPLSIRS
jgi:hypothetical protein